MKHTRTAPQLRPSRLAALGLLLTALSFDIAPSLLLRTSLASASEPQAPLVTLESESAITATGATRHKLYHGETVRLRHTFHSQAGQAIDLTGCQAKLFYQTPEMADSAFFQAPAATEGASVYADWTPQLDPGGGAVRYFFEVENPQGKCYRANGLLTLLASPGFSPAVLEPIDLREQLKAELYALLQAELSAAFSADLQAEAEARAETDGAITEAVNAQAGVLEQHQGYLSTLSTNYNNLAASYVQSVTDLQTKDAELESALATKADASHTHAIADTDGLQAALDAKAAASALTTHANSWATGSTGGHVKLGTNYILATDDGNFGVIGKTSGNQLIYRIDATPTAGSSLPVKSGGIYTALASKAALEHTHSQYLTSYTESDPTIAAWAKAATKPTYTAAEVGAQPAGKYVTYDTTSNTLDAVSKETSFAGGIRTDSFKTLFGTPFFNTVSDYGFNITGFYRLNGYQKTDKPLLEWDVATRQSYLDVTKVYEGGTLLSNKYAPLSHTHSQYLTSFTESDPTIAAWAKAATKPTYNWTEILNRPTTWDWANLTNKPTTFPPATHNHDGTYLKLTGGTVTGNVTFTGSSNYMEKLEFGGSAGAAGLMTRGISGRNYSNAPGGTKDSLFLNYDGSLIPHSTYWNYGIDNARGVFVCGAEPGALVVRRIDLETILKDYAAKTHTHAMADTTGLQAALDSLAPLSSVTCTTNDVTYIWQWDEEAGTFALVERE